MAEPIVRLTGVRKHYGEQVITPVLHGIDLEIQAGEFAALIGPSGSGKSTLLNLLGLLDQPSSGRIEIAGTETSGMTDAVRTQFRGGTLGFIFQFHYLLPAFTAFENVMLPGMARQGRPTEAMREGAMELLREVGLEDQAGKRVNEMSGGQQQRVAIARSLVNEPKLILADEPTGELDSNTAQEILGLFRSIVRERNMTFLMVTHDSLVDEFVDEVLLLRDGQVVSTLDAQPEQTE